MSLLTNEVRAFIGRQSERVSASDPVEAGAIRRYAQAIMDDDPLFRSGAESSVVAPALFPSNMFRRAPGSEDPLSLRAADPNFDGLVVAAGERLPELIPLRDLALLNGGAEFEFFRYARVGEMVSQQSRYADITERETSKGPMLFVVVETDYFGENDEILLRARKTTIRRKR
jgi:hypothetical protein